MTTIEGYATQKAERLFGPAEESGQARGFISGILHLAERLQDPDVIEAGSLFSVSGRCWENYGGGEEYCEHASFTSRADAEKHRADHHSEHGTVWQDAHHMERLAAMLAKIAEGAADV